MLLCFWLCSIVALIVLCRVAIDLLQTVAVLRLGGVAAVESAIRMVRPRLWLRHPATTIVLDVDVVGAVERVRPQSTTARILFSHAGLLDQSESVKGKSLMVVEHFFDRLGRR